MFLSNFSVRRNQNFLFVYKTQKQTECGIQFHKLYYKVYRIYLLQSDSRNENNNKKMTRNKYGTSQHFQI